MADELAVPAVKPFSDDDERTIIRIADIVRRRLMAQGFSLARILDEKSQVLYVFSETIRIDELKGMTVPADTSIAGKAALEGKPQFVANAYDAEQFYPNVDSVTRFTTGSVIAAPIMEGERLVGVLECVREAGKEPYIDEQFHMFQGLAADFEETIQDRDAKDVWNLCFSTFDRVQSAIASDGVSFLVWSARRQVLEFFASETIERGRLAGYRMPIGKGIIGQCAATGEVVRVDEAYRTEGFVSAVDEVLKFRTGSVICLPIYQNDLLIGVIQVIRRGGFPPFARGDQIALEGITAPLTEILVRADINAFPDTSAPPAP